MWRRMALWALRIGYLGLLGALFVLSGYVGFSLFVRRGVTPVPNVVGLEVSEAEETLADNGLDLTRDEEDDRFAADVPPGHVLEQRPRGGSLAKRGGAVTVVVSRGQRVVEVPDLTGKALPAAQVTLQGLGLETGKTLHVLSAREAVGTIVTQDPGPGATVERGAPIAVFIAGEQVGDRYVMPDLVNRDYREVRRFLESRGFRVGSVKFERYEGIRDPLVLRQFPLPGHPVGRSEPISLVVAAVEGGAADQVRSMREPA